MIQIAIVEDEEIYVKQLTEYIRKYQTERGRSIKVTVFGDGEDITENYNGVFDIILMDIQMRFMDGMTAAEKIRQMDQKVIIMFITNMIQYAVRGYEVDAMDYVVKPVEDMELFERHGAPVEEKIFADVSHAAEKIAETLKLGEEEYETAAVVLRTEKEAEHMWLLLKEILGEKGFDIKERLSYLDRNSTSFKKGLTVTTFYLAKGLEFDQVFAVFPQKDRSPLVRQARYIAATRALHELHMYEVEK